MASASRAQFSSKLGFIMAAAGSAVGLGNVWGFPTQAASNGGAVFLLVYLVMVVVLALPMLIAELTIGRYGQANPLRSIASVWPNASKIPLGFGLMGLITALMILSFYSIIAGWLVGYLVSPILDLVGLNSVSHWLETFSTERNLFLAFVFIALTMKVVMKGVTEGIERWSSRLMPLLVGLFVVMIIYIMMQDGAIEGLKMYLVPDFSHFSSDLVVGAMGQAFFSLSLGVTVMIVYGSYLPKDVNIPKTAAQVAAIDTGIAFGAGLLILPAMFVAQKHGVQIYDQAGQLLNSDTLVFTVLPAMFDSMGSTGAIVSVLFFALMLIAALTSSISMLEVPVSCAIEELGQKRSTAVWWIGGLAILLASLIVFNFGSLFGLVITVSTVYLQPLLGLVWAICAGWVWNRAKLLEEIRQGHPDMENSFFWKVWPNYLRYVCPILMGLVFWATI
ncbi:sodium-dependent transporter [Vibrio rumoiensis]|uniref:Transporter n=1 Tax=Vibrio rumoiensis 1S-45 TaxID=1188252 RepID=A0A1E5E447_9VIBR|nr:sodium-dependent transporter [Vibrio rumoiensis]OEF27451.1 transporter [Vibrio rumoiensis 1S-45]